jgi:hypothetical protein
MLTSWRSHCWRGPCQFGRTETSFSIQTDADNARGGWICVADTPVTAGDIFILSGTYHTGTIHALWYLDGEYLQGSRIEPGYPFMAPEDANRLRIDLRLWNQQGFAEFRNIMLSEYGGDLPQDEPEDPPAEETEPLPVPLPDLAQKHHVTGWKWGRNIALMVHEEETSTPPYYGDDHPYEVKGWQHGRRLDLEIGNMYFDDEEE